MSRKKGSRPISRGIQYTVPGHVVGGSEPASWKVAKEARKADRIRANLSKLKPVRRGPVIASKYDNECFWCGQPIKSGMKIAPVELPQKKWLHVTCTRVSAEEN